MAAPDLHHGLVTAIDRPDPQRAMRQRHLRFGWWTLLLFASIGVVLEMLHGFKVDWYLDVGNETRRLLWRLGHAHGTFVALVHLGFAISVAHTSKPPRLASACLIGASIAMPAGFFLGGIVIYGGDPGAGIVLLPLGAAMLLVAIASTALAVTRAPGDSGRG